MALPVAIVTRTERGLSPRGPLGGRGRPLGPRGALRPEVVRAREGGRLEGAGDKRPRGRARDRHGMPVAPPPRLEPDVIPAHRRGRAPDRLPDLGVADSALGGPEL